MNLQDIFRKYPQRYEGIIPTLCASLDELDEPDAKASLIWILGEYADKIDNADELIGGFLENYAEEPIQVGSRRSALGYRMLSRLLSCNVRFNFKPSRQLLSFSSNAPSRLKLLFSASSPSPPRLPTLQIFAIAPTSNGGCSVATRKLQKCVDAWQSGFEDMGLRLELQSVILAARPPITLPATSVPAGLLEELIGELGSLRYVSRFVCFVAALIFVDISQRRLPQVRPCLRQRDCSESADALSFSQ